MELLLVGALGGLGYMMVSPSTRRFAKEAPEDLDTEFRALARDFSDAGISMGADRTAHLNVTNLNEAWKPRTAPRQGPTRNVNEIFRDQADRDSYLFQYAPQFFFRRTPEVILSNAEQSNPNVEIPAKGVSIHGDPGNSLAYYPRVYYDYATPGQNPHIFSEDQGRGGAGQPTESEVRRVPREGDLNYNQNPWGPGGVLQQLFNRHGRQLTNQFGTDRSRVIAPPSGHSSSYRQYKRT